MDKVSMSHVFLSQDIKQNVLLGYLDSWWRHKRSNFFVSSSTAMTDRKKRGEDKNTKNWISWQTKEFFRWNKKQFS